MAAELRTAKTLTVPRQTYPLTALDNAISFNSLPPGSGTRIASNPVLRSTCTARKPEMDCSICLDRH